jgi:hypothetical protein
MWKLLQYSQIINIEKHKKAHICYEVYCKTFKDFFSEDHLCFMQPFDANSQSTKKQTKKQKRLFYEFTFIINWFPWNHDNFCHLNLVIFNLLNLWF